MDMNISVTQDVNGLRTVTWNFLDSTGTVTYDDMDELRAISTMFNNLVEMEYASMYSDIAAEAMPSDD